MWKAGLRVLVVHIDDGYDTAISQSNIKKIIEKTGFEYRTITPDEEQFNALTLAFMKAGVPNLAMPQDNVLFAFLYYQMKKNGLEYFLSGENFALECILQHGCTHRYTDVRNIRDINRKFGSKPINKLKFISTIKKMIDKNVMGVKTVRLLDYVDYNRDRAFQELNDFCGFEYYGRKHLENILTGFIQLYWFPIKFDVDKRKSHLSSMIVSGQLTREDAIKELAQPLFDESQMEEWKEYIACKMHISRNEFDSICNRPVHQHNEYKVEDNTLLFRLIMWLVSVKHKLTGEY